MVTISAASNLVATLASFRWRNWLLPSVVAIMALALLLPRLGTPDEYVFDELYYAYTAGRYVANAPNSYRCCRPPRETTAIEWTHPPLAKLAIAGGILVFGDSPLGWRVASVLCALLAIFIVFALGVSLTGSQSVGAIAAFLLLCDGVFFVEARTGTSNLLLTVLTSSALLAFAAFLRQPLAQGRNALLATGFLLSLPLATKWSAIALIGLVFLVYAWRVWRSWRGSGGVRLCDLGWGVVTFGVLPLVSYLASYAHFFLMGHSWSDFVSLQRSMLDYHRNLGVVHDYSSSWWEWPMDLRPVWYYADRVGDVGQFVFAVGNPLLYWPMVIAAGWVAIDWWGRKPVALIILMLGFFGQWLPWALSPRGTFIYHFLPAVPFGCLAIAVLMVSGWRAGGWRRIAVSAYGVAVVAIFAWFYPMYTAMPLTAEQVAVHMWLPSWR
jgi:dolichyl-phosphate-mannose-protein mannosyltransferase